MVVERRNRISSERVEKRGHHKFFPRFLCTGFSSFGEERETEGGDY